MSHGKYRQAESEEKWEIHPVWRGIGCMFFFLIPVIGFMSAVLLVQEGIPQQWIPLTPDLANRVTWPVFGTFPLYYTLEITAAVAFILYAFFVVLYAAIYRVIGPPKYGPQDAPPIKKKRGSKKRR
ncbi:MAG: hypothetical protein ACE5GO_09155 [Anaerolineales bacterium]